MKARIRSFSPLAARLVGILALGLLLPGCSEDDDPVGANLDLPPVTDSAGTIAAIRNTPADFPPAAFRTDLEVGAPASGTWVLRDKTTESLFTSDGWAFEGPMAEQGVRLPGLATMSAFWFAWSIFYPGSEVWGRDDVAAATIQSEAECLVPCAQIRRNLPRDAIPSLPNPGPPLGGPRFTSAAEASATYLRPGDLVVGLYDGTEARAYPHNLMWWHEIVNDTFGGQRLSVSLCPLTGSALVFSAESSAYGVSGNLYNSNLVLYDHATGSLFSQLRRQSVTGPRKGERLAEVPFVETTWARWLQMHPDTKVLSEDTGFSRNYSAYPYGDYRDDQNNTFAVTDPRPDPAFPGKRAVTGVQVGEVVRAYVHEVVASERGARAVFRDEIGGMSVWIVFDESARFLQIFHAGDPAFSLDLEWVLAP